MYIRLLILSILAMMLANCSSSGYVSGPMKNYKGIYKVGNPYEVDGIWYYPKAVNQYDEKGVASWYGPNFHGKKTANGDRFNKHDLTAAHKTLPLPSMIRVTNLDNDRTLILMVNDRGPFSNGRILDVSERGAKLLGFKEEGLARVRVEYLPGQSKQLLADLGLSPTGTQVAQNVKDKPVEIVFDEKTRADENDLYIQAGAFGVKENALKLQHQLSEFGSVDIHPVFRDNYTLYRVRLGPIRNQDNANWLLTTVKDQGFLDAKIVRK